MTHPFRFVHAAHPALDQPLFGCGTLTGAARETVRDATYHAFEALCDACLENEARFLLVTGRLFGDDEPTIRSLKALRDGFEQLGAAGIQVVVALADAPPRDGIWNSPAYWPENLTILNPGCKDPVEIADEDSVVATIETLDPAADHGRDDAPDDRTPTPLRIAVSPALPPGHSRAARFDYVAVGGGNRPKTVAASQILFHHPGGIQGLAPRESGPHGATLAEVEEGNVSLHPLPLAPVRWERLFVDVPESADERSLLEQMRTVLEQCEPEPAEQVWIIEWTLEGAGPLLATLARDGGARSGLIEKLSALLAHPKQLLHRLRCAVDGAALRGDSVAAGLLEELERLEAAGSSQREHRAAGMPPERLASILGKHDDEEIRERARRNLAQWLDGQGEAA